MRKKANRLLSLILAFVMLVGFMSAIAPPARAGWHSDTDIAYEVTDGKIYFDKSTGTIVACDESVTTANIPEAIEVRR